jgi:5-dehydro-4-deoxyglucarate dehydratase
MRRIVGAVRGRWGRDRLMYFNGMPTAEMTQQAYEGIGVPMYSSAVFCFAPDLAMGFYEAYSCGDDARVNALLDGFWIPYVQLRQAGSGYAVSLVKAGVRLAGLDVGPVRAPLSEPAAEHVERLAELLAAGRTLLAA